ncbi:SusC/RagA family TonB-linked outer membrane protein [Flammeovirga aprica]|uniref:TonB-dependent receptor n=1 Tax=Flammeovirga aprica JL-4 TaxID=694437 RepID=A0A7X9NZG3_9BACT|nr:TonB-dependent receptor [Flammeovirga aprica]NME66771.1 TonB-dependent receptor [Flammeovirga aprica JL-4]
MNIRDNKKSYLLEFILLNLLLFISLITTAQEVYVKGKVVDVEGHSLPGVSVRIQGTTIGTVTNFDGDYQLKVTEGNVLVFSFIGLVDKTFTVGKNTTIDVTMEEDINELNEVIVIGYGEVEKREVSTAMSPVDMTEATKSVSSNVEQMLSGRVAGVAVSTTDGEPGGAVNISVRGMGSITQGNTPLYVVDGFPYDGGMDSIDPNDIKSIEVLKDASATAIYGSRGANGVVLITTKGGLDDGEKLSVTYDIKIGRNEMDGRLSMMKPYDFVKYQLDTQDSESNRQYFQEGVDENGVPYRFQTLNDYIGYDGIDWQNEVFKPTSLQSHNITASGGTKKTRYRFSYGFFDEKGLFVNSGFKRNNLRLKINSQQKKWLKVDADVAYTASVKHGVGTSGNSDRFNQLYQIASYRPTGGNMVTDEELKTQFVDPAREDESGNVLFNPIISVENTQQEQKRDQLIFNGGVKIDFTKKLHFNSRAGIRLLNREDILFYKQKTRQGFNNGPYGSVTDQKQATWFNSNYMNYANTFNNHKISMVIGAEFEQRTIQSMQTGSKGLPTDGLGRWGLDYGTVLEAPISSYLDYRRMSGFARFNYSFKNKYIINGVIRADGSSKFTNKWGTFPALSVAWRAGDEQFIQDLNIFSNLKIRASWGQNGNDNIPDFQSVTQLGEVSNAIINGAIAPGVGVSNVANPNLTWETSEQINIGLDAGFFQDRITVTADWYRKTNKDLLLKAQQPYYWGGVGDVYKNVGTVRNDGIELSISSVNIAKKDFKWETTFNFTTINNQVMALSGEDRMFFYASFSSNYPANNYIAQVGQPIGQMWGFRHDGLYQQDDFTYNHNTQKYELKEGVPGIASIAQVQPGYEKYKDLNGDNVIDDNDMTVIGNALPDFFGGFNNSLTYKNIDFSIFFRYQIGHDILNATRLVTSDPSVQQSYNKHVDVANRWTPENPNTNIRSTDARDDKLTDRYVEDGSFIRLENITLGYTLPKKISERVYIQRLRLYTSLQNVFTWTNYSGMNPDVNTRGHATTAGVDWGAYPVSKRYTLGLNVTF